MNGMSTKVIFADVDSGIIDLITVFRTVIHPILSLKTVKLGMFAVIAIRGTHKERAAPQRTITSVLAAISTRTPRNVKLMVDFLIQSFALVNRAIKWEGSGTLSIPKDSGIQNIFVPVDSGIQTQMSVHRICPSKLAAISATFSR